MASEPAHDIHHACAVLGRAVKSNERLSNLSTLYLDVDGDTPRWHLYARNEETFGEWGAVLGADESRYLMGGYEVEGVLDRVKFTIGLMEHNSAKPRPTYDPLVAYYGRVIGNVNVFMGSNARG